MIRLSRDFVFDSAHCLPNHKGKCKNLHGHQWKLRVTLEGKVDEETGMIIDFKDLKDIVNTSVINLIDHRYLNEEVPFIPTAENLVKFIFERLKFSFFFEGFTGRIELVEVQLWETPDCCVTYGGK